LADAAKELTWHQRLEECEQVVSLKASALSVLPMPTLGVLLRGHWDDPNPSLSLGVLVRDGEVVGFFSLPEVVCTHLEPRG
jgi:hypothetical protein